MNNRVASFGLTIILSTGSAMAAGVNLQWNGSGCPKLEERGESAGGKVEAKRDVSASFALKKGPGVRLLENRKNCSLLVTSEGGKEQFALEKVEIDGKAPAAGSQQELTVDVSSQGQGQTKSITLRGDKGTDAKFSVVKALADADQVWSPCDRGLMINAKQRIENGDKATTLTSSVDTIHYHFKSKPCGNK